MLEADFARVDTGGDGSIDFEELLAGVNWDGSSAFRVPPPPPPPWSKLWSKHWLKAGNPLVEQLVDASRARRSSRLLAVPGPFASQIMIVKHGPGPGPAHPRPNIRLSRRGGRSNDRPDSRLNRRSNNEGESRHCCGPDPVQGPLAHGQIAGRVPGQARRQSPAAVPGHPGSLGRTDSRPFTGAAQSPRRQS